MGIKLKNRILLTGFVLGSLYFGFTQAFAADAEQVDVDSIKQRYWARGNESELGVVQNRQFTKSGKYQLGLFGGVAYTDPFLTVNPLGVTLGYHLSESLALQLIGWYSAVSNSAALTTFEQTVTATANTNKPKAYGGLEANFSLLYGKLSLLGKSIIYYDLHLIGGMGMTSTESGDYLTPSVGFGQRFYLSSLTSLRIDYRLMIYKERLLEKNITKRLGSVVDERTNLSNTITVGIDFLFGGESKAQAASPSPNSPPPAPEAAAPEPQGPKSSRGKKQ